MKKLVAKQKQNLSNQTTASEVQVSSKNILTTKRLNLLGKLSIIGVYTLVIMTIVAAQLKQDLETELKETISSIKIDQKDTKAFIQKQFDKINKDLQYSTQSLNLENRLIEHINQKIRKSKTKEGLKLQSQQNEINQLKQKLQALLKLTSNSPKSESEETLKTLTYSKENYDILYYQHQQVLKRLKEENKEKEQAFITVHDMTKEESQIKLKQFKDELNLQLYAKKRKLTSMRQKFRKDKFINLVANF